MPNLFAIKSLAHLDNTLSPSPLYLLPVGAFIRTEIDNWFYSFSSELFKREYKRWCKDKTIFYKQDMNIILRVSPHKATNEKGIGIAGIYVVPSLRRQGYGKQMLTDCCEIADKLGVSLYARISPFTYEKENCIEISDNDCLTHNQPNRPEMFALLNSFGFERVESGRVCRQKLSEKLQANGV